MSSNSTVNMLVGAVVGIATAGLGWAIGFSYYSIAGLAAFSITSSLLNARNMPGTPAQKPQDFSNAGRAYSGRQVAADALNVNSAAESLSIPVAFGTVRLGANFLRYDTATFRNTPVVERIEKSREAVAYMLARDTFRNDPSKVDREIDESAKKQGGGGGKGGGKSGGGKGGGGGKSPAPSQSFSDAEKINQYTTDLLADDETGEKRLPKEYDERTVAHKYNLTWELGICMGPVTKLHAIRIYPGEEVVCDRYDNPDIVDDDTEITGSGGQQGGNIRFYSGSPTQTRNEADIYKAPYSNYRNVCFALFDDYQMGLQPSPSSYAFEVERMPVCLDAAGDVLTDIQTRAGEDTTAQNVLDLDWLASEITIEATAHGLVVGDVFFLDGFAPAAYDGTLTVTAVPDANHVKAAMKEKPGTATTFGTVQGPDTATAKAISAASWSAGIVSFTITGHGLVLDQAFTVAGMTPSGYNGNYTVLTRADDDHVTATLVSNPGAATVNGTSQAHPLPVAITSAEWADNVATYQTSGDHNLNPADAITIAGFIPAEWNGASTVGLTASSSEFTATLEINPGPVTVMGTIKKRPDAGYGDANPAAVVYEVLTNQIWGLGMSPDLLDIPSFERCSDFYLEQKMGMSFAIETQTDIAGIIETIRSHVGLSLIWLGDKFYCRTVLDPEQRYSPIFKITADQVSDVNVSRPAWSASINELGGTYLDRFNNYQSGRVAATDDASIATIGRVNSKTMNLPAFSSRETAEKAIQRMLSEAAYPQAVLKFTMNRTASQLFPTAFVQFTFNEWGDSPITTYWHVSEITDSDTDSGKIDVTLVEDVYSTPVEGTVPAFVVPIPAYENMPRTTEADLDFSDKPIHLEFGDTTINLHEPGIVMTDGDRTFAVFAQRTDHRLQVLKFYARMAAKGSLVFATLPVANETVTIGSTVYTWKASVTTGAFEVKIGTTIAESIANLVAAITAGAGSGTVYGSATTAHDDCTAAISYAYAATATWAPGGNALNGIVVTIGDKKYTWRTTLTPKEGEIKVGASLSASMTNMANAINGNGTYGTDHYCAAENEQVKARKPTTTTVLITARIPGAAGNKLVLAESSAVNPWTPSATLMTGGSDRATNRIPGNENVLLVTALIKGPEGNLIDTTTTSDCIEWTAAKLANGSDYLPLGDITPWSITGTLVEALPIGNPMTRDGVFEIQLDRPEERARFLEYCSLCPTDDDGLDKVTGAATNWLVIGNEFIQVAQAEAGSQSNRVRCTAYIREQNGSEQEDHAAGAKCSFAYDYTPYDQTARYDQLPADEEVQIKAIPTDRRGLVGEEEYTFMQTFTGLARKALRISTITATAGGLNYTVSYRPRWHNRGAEMVPDFEVDMESIAREIPTGYETYVMPINSSGYDLKDEPVKVSGTYVVEDPDDDETGLINFTYTAPSGTTALIVYQAYRGVLGLPITVEPS